MLDDFLITLTWYTFEKSHLLIEYDIDIKMA